MLMTKGGVLDLGAVCLECRIEQSYPRVSKLVILFVILLLYQHAALTVIMPFISTYTRPSAILPTSERTVEQLWNAALLACMFKEC